LENGFNSKKYLRSTMILQVIIVVCGVSWTEGPEHGFAHFWITDSCATTVKDVMGRPPFEVLSLAGSIAAALHI
jgi:hypothetical protein